MSSGDSPELDTPGKRLKWLAEKRGLKQIPLAVLLELDQGTVSRIYSGDQKLTPEQATDAGAKLGARAGWLLFNEGAPFHLSGEDAAAIAYMEGRASAFREIAELGARLATGQDEELKRHIAARALESVKPHAPAAPEAKRRRRG